MERVAELVTGNGRPDPGRTRPGAPPAHPHPRADRGPRRPAVDLARDPRGPAPQGALQLGRGLHAVAADGSRGPRAVRRAAVDRARPGRRAPVPARRDPPVDQAAEPHRAAGQRPARRSAGTGRPHPRPSPPSAALPRESLPAIYCRHCGRSGWAAISPEKDPQDLVGDPQKIYRAAVSDKRLVRAFIAATGAGSRRVRGRPARRPGGPGARTRRPPRPPAQPGPRHRHRRGGRAAAARRRVRPRRPAARPRRPPGRRTGPLPGLRHGRGHPVPRRGPGQPGLGGHHRAVHRRPAPGPEEDAPVQRLGAGRRPPRRVRRQPLLLLLAPHAARGRAGQLPGPAGLAERPHRRRDRERVQPAVAARRRPAGPAGPGRRGRAAGRRVPGRRGHLAADQPAARVPGGPGVRAPLPAGPHARAHPHRRRRGGPRRTRRGSPPSRGTS